MSNDPTDELTVTTDPEEIRSWAETRQLVPAYVRAGEAAELVPEAEGGRHEFVPRDELGEHHEMRGWDAFLETVEEENLALTYYDADEEAWGQYALIEQSETEDISHEDLRAAGPPPEDAARSAAAEAPEGPGEAVRERVATELAEREVLEADWIDEDTVELKIEEAWLVTEEVVEGDERRTVERDVTERRRLTADIVDSVVVESGTANRETLEGESMDDAARATDAEAEQTAGGKTSARAETTATDEPPRADEPPSGQEASEGIPIEAGVTDESGATEVESAGRNEDPSGGETPPTDETPPTEAAGEQPPAEDTGAAGETESESDEKTPGGVNATGENTASDELGGAGTSTDTGEDSLGAERPDVAEGRPRTDDPRGTADVTVSEHDEGKTVVDANDNEVGIVTDVRGGDVYIDPNPDIVDKVAAKLGWSSADEESYTVNQADVAEVRHDEVKLAPLEGLDR